MQTTRGESSQWKRWCGEEVPSEKKYRGYGEARQGCRAYTARRTEKQYTREKVIEGIVHRRRKDCDGSVAVRDDLNRLSKTIILAEEKSANIAPERGTGGTDRWDIQIERLIRHRLAVKEACLQASDM